MNSFRSILIGAYRLALLAYPRSFRHKFSDEMMLQIRDELREADRSVLGTLRIAIKMMWDLLRTAPTQHILGLSNCFKGPKGSLLAGSVLTFLIAASVFSFIVFRLPEFFKSSAVLDMEGVAGPTQQSPLVPVDPFSIARHFEQMRSPSVLKEVVDQLKLAEKWGRLYFKGNPISAEQASQILSARLQLSQVRNTSLIKLEIVDEDPLTAAAIARQFIDVYKESNFKPGTTVKIVDAPEAPNRPYAPNIPENIFYALAMAAVLGFVMNGLGRLWLFLQKSRTSMRGQKNNF